MGVKGLFIRILYFNRDKKFIFIIRLLVVVNNINLFKMF